jgi:hypothetical protein
MQALRARGKRGITRPPNQDGKGWLQPCHSGKEGGEIPNSPLPLGGGIVEGKKNCPELNFYCSRPSLQLMTWVESPIWVKRALSAESPSWADVVTFPALVR